MKYIAAYLLAQAGGKSEPAKDDVNAILNAAGISVDDGALSTIFTKFEGKSVEDLIKEGSAKIATVAGGPAIATAAPVVEAVEAKKEEEAAVEVNLGDMFDW